MRTIPLLCVLGFVLGWTIAPAYPEPPLFTISENFILITREQTAAIQDRIGAAAVRIDELQREVNVLRAKLGCV